MRGFSLVELSIVLVILGLLTGGILAGQNLIRASELRTVTTQYQSYMTAVQTFRDKYFALPGDMRNATAFWGTATNCPGTSAQGTTDGTTCDGDGDGIIDVSTSSNERFRFWQHLANAGLIEGNYNGVTGPDHANLDSVAGLNAPAARVSTGVWHTFNADYSGSGTSVFYQYDYGNFLIMGVDSTTYGTNPIFTTEEGWNIDTKMDDGLPARGKVHGGRPTGCSDGSATTLDANYSVIQTGLRCNIIFPRAF